MYECCLLPHLCYTFIISQYFFMFASCMTRSQSRISQDAHSTPNTISITLGLESPRSSLGKWPPCQKTLYHVSQSIDHTIYSHTFCDHRNHITVQFNFKAQHQEKPQKHSMCLCYRNCSPQNITFLVMPTADRTSIHSYKEVSKTRSKFQSDSESFFVVVKKKRQYNMDKWCVIFN